MPETETETDRTFEEIVQHLLDDVDVPDDEAPTAHFTHPNRSDIAWCGQALTQPATLEKCDSVSCEHCMYLLRTIGAREFYYQRGSFGYK